MTAPAPATSYGPQQPQDQGLSTATQLALLLIAYQQATQAIRNQLASFVTAVWRSLGIYRNDQMARFIAEVTPVVTGAQQHMASLTAAHLAQLASVARDVPFQPVAIDPATVSGAAVRNGADPAEVYGRPFHLVWRQLGDYKQMQAPPADYVDRSIRAGEDRAVQTALTDLQLAKTHGARQQMASDPHVVGYRRVLEGAHSCGLCIVASTLRYRKENLLPIHPGCDCSVAPIYGYRDPGRSIEIAARDSSGEIHTIGDLGDLHASIAERFGKSDAAARIVPGAKDGKGQPLQYKDALVIHDHGELGPVLGVRGQPFLGPNDLS